MIKIVPIYAGLGNQMFQYAFYLSLRSQYRLVYYNSSHYLTISAHNGYELNKVFNIKPSFKFKKLIYYSFYFLQLNKLSKRFKYFTYLFKNLGINIIRESENEPSVYKESYLEPNLNGFINIYWGYWQSFLYWENMNKKVVDAFTFDVDKISSNTRSIMLKMQNSNSVSIHIRRGDYLKYNIVLDLEYYKRGISYISNRIKNCFFYIFSDDVDWIKINILDILLGNYYIVDINSSESSWQDLFLMTKCKHNIIANSSFSWWGAYLIRIKEK